jgi:hypothetical protein
MSKRKQTEEEFVRGIFRDARSTSKRMTPGRRAFAQRVLNNVFDRHMREHPEEHRRRTQEYIHNLHRAALTDPALAREYRKHVLPMRELDFDVPDLPPRKVE